MVAVEIRSSKTADVLADAHEIRREVFIDEQDVPESIEMDGKDEASTHLVAYRNGTPVGTARLREVDPTTGKVERVAVREDYREEGIGERLMERAEDILADRGAATVVVHAQLRVEGFYDRLGYDRVGDEFEEADIPHVEMVRTL